MFIPEGFVYVSDYDPSIRTSLRYATTENFVGRPIPGYFDPVAILKRETAEALCEAQRKFNEKGYDIVIYDAYRPQKAVNSFKEWAGHAIDQKRKATYYPAVNKAELFQMGFIATRSSHSRGYAVDLTIIKQDQTVCLPVRPEIRLYGDGQELIYLNDNTVDMGIHFDFFGPVSFTNDQTISPQAQENRSFLCDTMRSCGFKNYHKEWWHFQLAEEADVKTHYDFDIIYPETRMVQ